MFKQHFEISSFEDVSIMLDLVEIAEFGSITCDIFYKDNPLMFDLEDCFGELL